MLSGLVGATMAPRRTLQTGTFGRYCRPKPKRQYGIIATKSQNASWGAGLGVVVKPILSLRPFDCSGVVPDSKPVEDASICGFLGPNYTRRLYIECRSATDLYSSNMPTIHRPRSPITALADG